MNKKLSLLAIALMASILMMCSDDKVEPAPSITVDPISAANIPGGLVTTNVTFSAPNGAKQLFVYVAGVEEEVIELAGVASPLVYEYTVPANAVIGSTIVVAFQVLDNQNYPSPIANFVVTVGDPVNILQGILTTQTLDASKPYLLKGQVFIPTGVTLTVPAGTVVKGDKATKATLIVQPGGKLVADGNATTPVVFTSAQAVGERDRGDWGGIIMLGNAFVNQPTKPAIEGITPTQNYGSSIAEAATPATNANENSGSLKYTRIEYAGIELTPNNETNSLTMGALGNGTTIEYVQVSFGGDDGFEWFGGTVNGKYLVSLSTWDDDFDTDFGFGGNIQFGLVVRNPFFADQSGSNAFESDNQGNGNPITNVCDGTTNTGCTRAVFSNITVLGPREIQTRTLSANYQNAAHIRRRTAISIFNSYFSGYRVGIRLDDQGTLDNLNGGTSRLANNVLSVPGSTRIGSSTSAADANFATGLSAGDATALATYWTNNTNGDFNTVTTTTPHSDLGINAALFWGAQTTTTYPSNPDFRLLVGVPGTNNLNGGSSFADPKLAVAFFTGTAYRGAFSAAADWTDGWSEFQPLNKVY